MEQLQVPTCTIFLPILSDLSLLQASIVSKLAIHPIQDAQDKLLPHRGQQQCCRYGTQSLVRLPRHITSLADAQRLLAQL